MLILILFLHKKINQHTLTKYVPETPTPTAKKKLVQLRLPFYGDGYGARLRQKLTAVTNKLRSQAHHHL